MRNANAFPFKWLILLIMTVLLVIVILNVDGWGTFLLDVAFTLFVQMAIAIMLFGWLVFVVDIGKGVLKITSLSRNLRLGVFLAAVIVALPFIGIVFRRPVDIFDIAQTVLVIAAGLLFEPLARFFARPPIDRTSLRHLYRQPGSTARVASYAKSALYQNLLGKAGGDKEKVERLIEYERKRQPELSWEESMSSAIERWEQDNR